MKQLLLAVGLLLLFSTEIVRVYLIMPFPGSQQSNTIGIAYWLHNNIGWLRIVGLLLIVYPVIHIFKQAKTWKKVLLVSGLALYAVIFYFFNFRFLADKMFYQPTDITFARAAANNIPGDKLVIGVTVNGESKAYPIQLIGYHHQVQDSLGNTPIMVTYCTVCRTGRVFSPVVNGQKETFRLVGMDHFNALFEDATTKSWWRQVSGEAIAGPLKGRKLAEIPSTQATLAAWMAAYPNSGVLQPDTSFKLQYEHLADFDKGTIDNHLEKRDSGSWQFKSWVVGIVHGKWAKAYDWNDLVRKEVIQDSLPGLPVLLLLESDTTTFHIWNRRLDGQYLQFVKGRGEDIFRDLNTQSAWNMNGVCIEGPLKGQQLLPVQSYQEFWHSWSTFHPGTERYQ
ncbi:DUF3179 domain-containing protein [Pseudoflavitalea sp. X16]|uniref:DUF3179 domain-containing (seleno)protein n=1 Tax=Paraflavitalea devenefica TaxID=2716334 RepID=UPI00141F56F0|nr:DUF3179 domain-containing (seleno)protein [Paraflavitalea devenefica]NII28865.1 DUF3179 domain-containing protein [Paraflavitalea devenefica]